MHKGNKRARRPLLGKGEQPATTSPVGKPSGLADFVGISFLGFVVAVFGVSNGVKT